MLREFFIGFIKIHILHHSAEEEISGIEIMEELGRHGYSVSPGVIYPTLHRLEKEGYLKSSKAIVGGRVRRCYRATSKGIEALEEAKTKIKELIYEIIPNNQNSSSGRFLYET
jgi:PadR family transcriptional regulator PadR